MQYLSRWGLNRCVFNYATGISFYSRQGIDIDKIMKNNNLLIGYKHDKKIYVIERFVINALWKRVISCLWVHAGARLDVLWKGNIGFLWVLENDFVPTIVGDSNFSWLWDWLHWKDYLLIFPCIWRTSKSEVVHVLCVNLNVRWSWTPNWKQIWKVNKHDLNKLERNKDIRHTHDKEIYVIEIFIINVL